MKKFKFNLTNRGLLPEEYGLVDAVNSVLLKADNIKISSLLRLVYVTNKDGGWSVQVRSAVDDPVFQDED